MAAGDISKEDIMNEAGDMMKRMKEMGGAEQFADMFKNMAKGMGVNIPKGAKMDVNGLKQMEQKMTARDKMKARAEAKKQKAALEQLAEQAKMQKQMADYQKAQAAGYTISETETPSNYVYRVVGDEKQEKSSARPIGETPALSAGQKKKAKKKAKKERESETPVDEV